MKKTTRSQVFEAIQDLHAQEQIVTRETLAALTGLSLTVIDDRVARLIDDGDVVRVQRGVFKPAPVHPPARPISKTVLPDGMVKIEIGDEILELTPRENRMLGDLMAGAAVQYSQVEAGHAMTMLVADVRRELSNMTRKGDSQDAWWEK